MRARGGRRRAAPPGCAAPHADRSGRRRQDPPRAAARRAAGRRVRRWRGLRRPRAGRRPGPGVRQPSPRRSACRVRPTGRSVATLRRALRDAQLLLVLDNFEQVAGGRAAGRRAAGGCPAAQGAGHQPRAAARCAASTSSRCRRWRCPTRRTCPPLDDAGAVRGGRACSSQRAAGRQARLRADRRRTPPRWPRSAPAWTACRWRSSWRPRGSRLLSPAGAAGAAGAPAAAADRRRARPARPASRRCATRSPGATTCSRRTSRRCSAGWPSSSAAARWRRPRRSATADGDAGARRARRRRVAGRQEPAVQQDERPDGEPRFRMLETIREYGLERLAAAARRRRPAPARGLVSGVGGAIWPMIQRRLEPAQSDRTAWTPSTTTCAPPSPGWTTPVTTRPSLRLAGAIFLFWYVHDDLREGVSWLERRRPKLDEIPVAVRARALLGAGMLAHYMADDPRGALARGESRTLPDG